MSLVSSIEEIIAPRVKMATEAYQQFMALQAPKIEDDIIDIHERLIFVRAITVPITYSILELQILKSKINGIVDERSTKIMVAEAKLMDSPTGILRDFSTRDETRAIMNAKTLDLQVSKREAENAKSRIQEALDLLEILKRDLSDERWSIESRVKIICTPQI